RFQILGRLPLRVVERVLQDPPLLVPLPGAGLELLPETARLVAGGLEFAAGLLRRLDRRGRLRLPGREFLPRVLQLRLRRLDASLALGERLVPSPQLLRTNPPRLGLLLERPALLGDPLRLPGEAFGL